MVLITKQIPGVKRKGKWPLEIRKMQIQTLLKSIAINARIATWMKILIFLS